MDLTDEALVAKYRQTKDQACFKSLVRRYEARLFNVAIKIVGSEEEAEEIVQETCIKLVQNLDKFRMDSAFSAWIFRIAHNACMDKLRHKRRRNILGFLNFDPQSTYTDGEGEENPAVTLSQASDPAPNPAEKLDLSEQGTVINESLRKLPESQRTVVILHDVEGFSYQEIAEIVGASVGTVRSRLHYGRLKLRELLEPYFDRTDMTPASR